MELTEKEKLMEKFWVALTAVIIKEDKCLLLEDSNHHGIWMLPGGRVDKGENAETALKRELKEELGLEQCTKLATIDYHIWYTPKRKLAMCSIINLVKIADVEIKLSDEHSSFKWVAVDELDNYQFNWEEIKRIIRLGFKMNKQYEIK